jgi:signal transduction histidine kinase
MVWAMLQLRAAAGGRAARPALPRPLTIAFDVVLVALLVTAGQLELFAGIDSAWPGSATTPVTIAYAVAQPLPLLARRRRPLTVLLAVVAIMVGSRLLFDTPLMLINGLCSIFVGIYSAARWGRHPFDYVSLLAPIAMLAVFSVTIAGFATVDEFGPDLLGFGLTFGAGVVVRRLAGSSAVLRESVDALEAGERVRTETAIAAERDRIASELHDIVAHCVSLMVVQAGSARKQLRVDPAASETSLRAVEETGREALIEMRRMLGVLTTPAPGDLEPQPSLAALEALLARFRAAGLEVELARTGVERAVPPGIDVCAYRLIQEGLTNALTHGDGARATLRVEFAPTTLELEVRNPLGRTQRRGGGIGLVSMRERTRLFGGEFEAGRTTGGEFRVAARLPWDAP